MRSVIERMWYDNAIWGVLLVPLSWLYTGVVCLRRLAYRKRWLRSICPGVPVVVVGNLTVGGTGKTPLVAWIVNALVGQGHRPGIVSRGYGGQARNWPREVTAQSDPAEVGDEPVLLARATGCPVVAAPDRVAAARQLVGQGVDVIVSDDGLQHYRLARDVEIAVRDGARGYGNGRVLPAGPLREPVSRLAEVDVEMVNGQGGDFQLELEDAHRVDGTPQTRCLQAFRHQAIHAVAGIGHPDRFFSALRSAHLNIVDHRFPDHHAYVLADLDFGDDCPVFMTEKDAVKCSRFAQSGHWYVPARAVLTQAAQAKLFSQLDTLWMDS